eukprot:TRINITY_DN7050_c0_g1_i2.p1 TRINITY_DN7050_c0_g1~~TRINITY_DN7050_c0_g1_i2.p1  ORF type:complete len:110 (-),score=10.12 TRINITY_DN7050_c0_g1_i2:15-344(-)
MSLRLNPLPSLESVFTRWRSEKERRRKVVHPQKVKKQYTMESDLDCIVGQFDSDYSECCSESDEDSDDVLILEMTQLNLRARGGGYGRNFSRHYIEFMIIFQNYPQSIN